MKTLYLHIGTTKTATTSIQRFLEENKDVLQKYGYCFPDSLHVYPRANKRRNAHFLVAKVWDADGSMQEMRESIINIIDKWSDDITIYPGHGDECTMGYVRKINREFLDIAGEKNDN